MVSTILKKASEPYPCACGQYRCSILRCALVTKEEVDCDACDHANRQDEEGQKKSRGLSTLSRTLAWMERMLEMRVPSRPNSSGST